MLPQSICFTTQPRRRSNSSTSTENVPPQSKLFFSDANRPIQADRDDPRTWDSSTWPPAYAAGFLGTDVAIGVAAWNNRQNPNIYQIFSNLMRRNDLWVSIDR
jgi:hypothetical protein